jgi:hypothetical protein
MYLIVYFRRDLHWVLRMDSEMSAQRLQAHEMLTSALHIQSTWKMIRDPVVTPHLPEGLHVFKPVASELFDESYKDLVRLFEKEERHPTCNISSDRYREAMHPKKRNQKRLMEKITLYEALLILYEKNYRSLLMYVLQHINVVANTCGMKARMLMRCGRLVFLRHRPYFDGSVSIGILKGSILNVAMGLERKQCFEMTPSVHPDADQTRRPIRITMSPGEGYITVGEAGSTLHHCIPIGNHTWRYSMAIQLPPVEGTCIPCNEFIIPVKNSDTTHDIPSEVVEKLRQVAYAKYFPTPHILNEPRQTKNIRKRKGKSTNKTVKTQPLTPDEKPTDTKAANRGPGQ